jgi:hypothetical protein
MLKQYVLEKPRIGSDSVEAWMKRSSTRLENGRPLQSLITMHYGFVEAAPSHVLGDGAGTFQTESLPETSVG